MDSELFVEELRPFLLQTTEHFVHELLSFAKAPFDMNAYSECVVYPRPEESNHEDRTGKFTTTFVQTPRKYICLLCSLHAGIFTRGL